MHGDFWSLGDVPLRGIKRVVQVPETLLVSPDNSIAHGLGLYAYCRPILKWGGRAPACGLCRPMMANVRLL